VDVEVGVGELLLHGLADLVEEVSLGVRLDEGELIELVVGFEQLEFALVDGFDDDAVGDTLAGGEAAAVALDDTHHVVRLVLFCFFVAEGDDDVVLEVVEVVAVEAPDELLEFVLLRLHWHLLEDQGGLSQHRDGLQGVREPGLALYWFNQTLTHEGGTSSNSATAALISGLFSFMRTVKAWTFHKIWVGRGLRVCGGTSCFWRGR